MTVKEFIDKCLRYQQQYIIKCGGKMAYSWRDDMNEYDSYTINAVYAARNFWKYSSDDSDAVIVLEVTQ